MYHIKPDKRSQTSADEIAAGLLHCLQTIPLNAVTFSDLHRATGVSRATIYRLFDTPEDVLHYQFDRMLAQAVPTAGPEQQFNARNLVEPILQLGMEHHDFLKILVDNGRFDLLYRYAASVFRLPVVAEQLFPTDIDPVQQEYLLNQLSMSVVAALITWARNGRRETAAEVALYLKRYICTVSAAIDAEENRTFPL